MDVRVRVNGQSVPAYAASDRKVYVFTEKGYTSKHKLSPDQILMVKRRYATRARIAAEKHLNIIGWTRERGFSDEALGLGPSWGSLPNEIIPVEEWTKLCEYAVRDYAKHRSSPKHLRRMEALRELFKLQAV